MDINPFFRNLFKLATFFGLLSLVLLFMTNRNSVEFVLVAVTLFLNTLIISGIVLISKWVDKQQKK